MESRDIEKLKPDRDAFEAKLKDLLRTHSGKYALFKGGELIDVYDDMATAYQEGLTRFGLERFYIGHVVEHPVPEQLPALVVGVIRACV